MKRKVRILVFFFHLPCVSEMHSRKLNIYSQFRTITPFFSLSNAENCKKYLRCCSVFLGVIVWLLVMKERKSKEHKSQTGITITKPLHFTTEKYTKIYISENWLKNEKVKPFHGSFLPYHTTEQKDFFFCIIELTFKYFCIFFTL